jgi:hypothetical protein
MLEEKEVSVDTDTEYEHPIANDYLTQHHRYIKTPP